MGDTWRSRSVTLSGARGIRRRGTAGAARGVGLLLVALLLGACALFSGPEAPQSDPSTPTPSGGAGQPTAGPEGPGTNAPILEYRREGGIAGFCDHLEVRPPVAIWESCSGERQEIPLAPNQQAQLLLYATSYASFEEERSDNPGGPDNMTQALIFNGSGEEPLPADALQALYDLVNAIAASALAGGS